MPRLSRFVLPGVVHHVVARGVNRTRLFQHGFDKDKYLKRFALLAADEQVEVHGYCLMDNHVHWLLTPTTERGLARLFGRAHTWWATYYNRKHGRTGHLFQSRYHSAPLDESHYWAALRYVELNPCQAGLTQSAEDWQHSSARVHLGGPADPLIHLVPASTRRRYPPADWRFFLGQADPALAATLRKASAANRPCGAAHWIASLEHTYRRPLAPRPPGRPKRAALLEAAG